MTHHYPITKARLLEKYPHLTERLYVGDCAELPDGTWWRIIPEGYTVQWHDADPGEPADDQKANDER